MSRHFVFAVAIAALFPVVERASACEFHGAGFGPPGSSWHAYYGNTNQNMYSADGLSDWANEKLGETDRKTDSDLFQRRPVARPTFANPAARAADTAKSRLALNDFQRSLGLRVITETLRLHASNPYSQTISQ